MGKFTPGPWKAYKRPEPIGHAAYEIHYSEDGECVAEVVHEEADALLMATAPELYESCKEMFEYMREWCRGVNFAPMLDRADKALAKAEGRET